MNICFVYDCEYPWDIRVEKICNNLVKDKHRVSLVCRNNNSAPNYSEQEKLKIYRLPHVKRQSITKLINITIFLNPLWLFKIFKIIKRNHCRIIIVRDLPLALSGIIVGKITGIPVVVDMAEPYPLTIRQRLKYEPFRALHIITRNIHFADLLEKITIKTANHIFVVCEEARNRLIELGAASQNVSIVRNTPELKKFQITQPKYPGIMKNIKNKFIVLYVGIIIGGRGIDIAIKALKEIKKKRADVKLVIVGNGKIENEMRSLTRELNLEDTVFFEGWVDNALVPEYINSCNLGLLPFMNTQHINHTIANKLFDFMAIGKPVLCSDVKPMRRIIEASGAGYLFKAENIMSLKDMIIQAIEDRAIKEKGKYGIDIVKKEYNWGIDRKKILSVVNQLAKA